MPEQNKIPASGPRCLTCRERRIKCDCSVPVCRNCQKSSRPCRKGNAFQLSWPPPRSRRALVLQVQHQQHVLVSKPRRRSRGPSLEYHFVHVFPDYVKAHYVLPQVAGGRGHLFFNRDFEELPFEGRQTPLRPPPSLYVEVQKMGAGGTDLISYFYHDASNSLPQLDNEPIQFRNLLLRMSLHNDSSSSKGVLYSIFCLSSIVRYGNIPESTHFKQLALQALQQSAQCQNMDTTQVLQHVAAGLLLCRAEIALGDDSGAFWALYICSLRTISKVFLDPNSIQDVEGVDARILYRYVNYHDVLAQFSLDHWRRPSAFKDRISVTFKGQNHEYKCEGPVYPLLHRNPGFGLQAEIVLLSQVLRVSKTESAAFDSASIRERHRKENAIEAELQAALLESKADCQDIASVDESSSETATTQFRMQRYMFLSACWIYFQRTCRHLTGPSADVTSLIDGIFAKKEHIRRLNIRIAPFSLFLIGNEAVTEEQRRSVLDLAFHMKNAAPKIQPCSDLSSEVTTMANVNCMLAAAWAQDDLHDSSQGYLDYVTKMEWVMANRAIIPPLV